MLENRIYVSLIRRYRRNVHTVEHDPARGWLLEASNHFECCGLAATRRAEHGEKLARSNREIGIVNSNKVAVRLRNVIELDHIFWICRFPHGAPRLAIEIDHYVLDTCVVIERVCRQIFAVTRLLVTTVWHLGDHRNVRVDPDATEVEILGHAHCTA